MDEETPSEHPDGGPHEGDVVGGQWRLARKIARSADGATFEAVHTVTDQKAVVWVLPPHLAADAHTVRMLQERVRTSGDDDRDGAVRFLQLVQDQALGLTYLAMQADAEGAPDAAAFWSRRVSALVAELAAGGQTLGVAPQPPPAASAPSPWAAPDVAPPAPAPPPSPANAPPGSLEWLRGRRLAAAAAGVAPFRQGTLVPAPATRGPPPTPDFGPPSELYSSVASAPPWPARAPEIAAAAPSAAAPARRRGPHPALWGSAAVLGVLVVGSSVLMQSGGSRPLASPGPIASAPAPVNDVTATPGPGPTPVLAAPLQALTGDWAAATGCDQPLQLTTQDGRLVARHPDGTVETSEIERLDDKGGVTVSTPAGLVTYRADGDTLVVVGADGRPSVFSRCPDAAANAAANVAGEATLIAMAMAGAGSARPEPPPIRDEIDVSAFAPKELHAGEAALVQIYLHLIDQADAVAERARAADAEAAPRGQTTLGLELARGVRVDIMLDAGGLGLEEPIQSVIWRGRPCAAQFAVQAAADAKLGQRVLTAQMLVDGVPLGRLAFTLSVAPAETAAASQPELTGDFARRYARAFLSYSSLDRPEVLKTAQTLSATGIDYFQDILSIEPGSEWRTRLFAEIDRCDLFLLFWSSHAAGSDWVRREAEYALARRHGSSEASPDIRPIILEGPPIPPPPASLAELHFNDMLRYVVVASELEARARRAADTGV